MQYPQIKLFFGRHKKREKLITFTYYAHEKELDVLRKTKTGAKRNYSIFRVNTLLILSCHKQCIFREEQIYLGVRHDKESA